MSRLLYIEASPRKNDSSSIRVAEKFLESYKSSRPGDDIDVLNLWETNLPVFNEATIEAKYSRLRGSDPSGREIDAWAEVEELVNRFTQASHYLFSVPMWNLSIPYVLKHYIDVLVQPGLTFSFSPETGPKGLVEADSVTAIYSSGAVYDSAPMDQLDFQKPYLESILAFIGLDTVQSVVVAPTSGATNDVQDALKSAERQAAELAEKLA